MNSLRERPRCVVQVLWGARPVLVDDLAQRLHDTLGSLAEAGGLLSGPWQANFTRAIEPHDVQGIRALVEASPVTDDQGVPAPGDGYNPSLYLGDWNVAQSDAENLGNLALRAQAGTFSTLGLVLEGTEIVAEARERSRALVQELARIWQPDSVSVSDGGLNRVRRELYPHFGRGSAGKAPTWGYLAWISDRFSRQLDVVAGASTTRFGPGTLLDTETWEPETAGAVWAGLIESRRLRLIEPQQNVRPQF